MLWGFFLVEIRINFAGSTNDVWGESPLSAFKRMLRTLTCFGRENKTFRLYLHCKALRIFVRIYLTEAMCVAEFKERTV